MMPRKGIEMTTITAPTTTPTEADGFRTAYRHLVEARTEYDTLRTDGAEFAALVEARGALHRARAEMALVRHGLSSQI
jgi:hypothetical protein